MDLKDTDTLRLEHALVRLRIAADDYEHYLRRHRLLVGIRTAGAVAAIATFLLLLAALTPGCCTQGDSMRASAAPYARLCPSLLHELGPIHMNGSSGLAQMGTAVHECMKLHILGTEADITSIAFVYDVDPDELEELCLFGRIRYDALREQQLLMAPRPEVRMTAGTREGTTDLISVDDEAIVVVDWKSGFKTVPIRVYDQIACYMWMAREKFGRRPEYVGVCEDLRLRSSTVYRFTDESLDAWDAEMRRVESQVGTVYNPGDACTYCKHKTDCAARDQWLSHGVRAMVSQQEAVTLGELYEQWKAAKAAVSAYERVLKSQVEVDGCVPIDDECEVRFVIKTRDSIKPSKAWPVLQSHGLTAAEIAEAMSISKTELLKQHKAKYGRGAKQVAADRLISDLKAQGAIESVPRRELVVMPRKPTQIEANNE